MRQESGGTVSIAYNPVRPFLALRPLSFYPFGGSTMTALPPLSTTADPTDRLMSIVTLAVLAFFATFGFVSHRRAAQGLRVPR